MEDLVKKRVRNLLLISDADVKAAKLILRVLEKDATEKLAGRVRLVVDHCEEILAFVETVKPLQPDMFEETRPIVVEEDEFTQGRVLITPNGIPPEQQEDNDN